MTEPTRELILDDDPPPQPKVKVKKARRVWKKTPQKGDPRHGEWWHNMANGYRWNRDRRLWERRDYAGSIFD
jgi:hypothetical protein